MDPSKRVYDEEKHSVGADYEGSSDLDKAKGQEASGSLYKPDGTARQTGEGAKGAAESAKKIASAVASPGGITGAASSLAKNSLNWLKNNKKKSAAGAGIIATIFTVLFGMFMLLIPLKIEHVVKNLEKRFFATSEDAMGNMSDHMVKRYIKNKVIPGYNKCGTTVSRKCVAVVNKSSTNPVTRMYNAWSDNRLENKLADKGIEFEKKGGTWKMKYVKWSPNGVDIGPQGQQIDKEFKNRKEIRAAAKDVVKNETRWKQVMYRYRVGRLLETKYGIKRCLVFCGTRDAFTDLKAERKTAAKLYLIERVITPRNANMGVVFTCLLSSNCDEKLKSEATDPATDPATEGAPKSELEGEMRTKLQTGSSEFGDMKKQKEIKDGIEKDGFKKWLAKEVLGPILGETGSKIAVKAAPIVGWIDLASTVVHTAKEAGPMVKKLIYLSNAPAAVSLYMQYRTYADELHTGKKDATEVGSFVSSLGPNSKNTNFDKKTGSLKVNDTKDNVRGGIAGAEQSPLYGAIIGGKNAISSNSSFVNPLTPNTYAASKPQQNKNYLCNDGKPLPAGKLICPEEKLGQDVGPLSSLSGVLNSPWLSPIVVPLEIWHGTVGWLLAQAGSFVGEGMSAAFGIIDKTCGTPLEFAPPAGPLLAPAYCETKDPISNAIKDLGDTITNALIPNPFADNMSGGRTFNMMAAGANVAGNDACTQMGCGKVDKKFVANVINSQQQEDFDNFKKQPIYARLFNTESDYSLISRVAMATPIEYQSSVQTSFASLMSNPLGGLFSAFGNIFGNKFTSAAASENTVDVFNIGNVGYDTSKYPMPDDPEAYWEQNNCSEQIKKWQEEAADNESPTTGMPVHNAPSACLLIKNAVSNLGGAMDSSLLSDDDKKHVGSSGSGSSSATDTASETIDMANLYKDSSNIACASGSRDIGVQDGYHAGQKVKVRVCALDNINETGDKSDLSNANGKLLVNSRLSAFYVKLVKDAKQSGVQGISAQEGFRTMSRQRQLYAQYGAGRAAQPGNSNHQMGLAVDWNKEMVSYLQQKPHGLKATVPNEPWHWSPTGN